MSRRTFRPTMDRLETLCLLDGSSPTGPLYPPPTPPADSSSSPGSDPTIAALDAADQAAIQAADPASLPVDLPGMTMTNKDDEIKAINDDRDRFNAALDARRAELANSITVLTTTRAQLVTIVAGLDPANATEQPLIKEALDAIAVVDAKLPGIKARDAGLVEFRDYVNARIDDIILNIQSQYFVYNDVVIATYYTSAPYSASA